jgi:phospholipid/cholesterol/gamma-HCH transport system substrate-binding protein
LDSIFADDREIISTPYGDGEFLDYGTKSQSLFEMQNDLEESFDAIRRAGESIVVAGDSVNQLAIEVRNVVGGADSKVDELAEEAVKTLEEFQGAIRDIRTITGNPVLRNNLERSLAELPEVLADARAAFDSTQETFESFERVGNQFEKVGVAAEETVRSAQDAVDSAQQTISNLEQFTDPLAERGDELVAQVMQSLASLDNALVQVEAFGKTINNSDGSLKRFLEDDDIYFQVRRTIENIEQASARIRPIMDDVRIFTDKIARDPRELGVRGALGKRPSGSGYK